LYLSKISSK